MRIDLAVLYEMSLAGQTRRDMAEAFATTEKKIGVALTRLRKLCEKHSLPVPLRAARGSTLVESLKKIAEVHEVSK